MNSALKQPERSRRRRILEGVIVVFAVLGLIWFARTRRPVEVEAVYTLGAGERRGLETMHVTWDGDPNTVGDEVSAVFRYRGVGPAEQAHALSLPRGTYAVEALLEYDDGHSDRRVVTFEVSDDSKVTIPLGRR